jgi:hypothetical protein
VQVRVARWGNSLGLRIPKDIAAQIRLRAGPLGRHRGVIMITGIGDHLRPEWPITITGMRTPRRERRKLPPADRR